MNVFPLDDNQEEEPPGTLCTHKAYTNKTTWLQGKKVRINNLVCLETFFGKTKIFGKTKSCLLPILGSPVAFKTCLFMGGKMLKTDHLF